MALRNEPQMVDQQDEGIHSLGDMEEWMDQLSQQENVDIHNASLLSKQVEELFNNESSTREQLASLHANMANKVEDNLWGIFWLNSDELAWLHTMDNLDISWWFTNT